MTVKFLQTPTPVSVFALTSHIILYFIYVASLSNLGQLGGSLITGVLSNWLGRRPTIITLCAPLLSGWAIVGFSGGDFWWICLGRIFQGVGIMSSVTQVYLVEISDAKRRYCNTNMFEPKIARTTF